jgi:hypothetical protein
MRADTEKLRGISYLRGGRRRLGGFLTVVEMVPARARRKTRTRNSVVPAKAGTQLFSHAKGWIPAFAGMTRQQ